MKWALLLLALTFPAYGQSRVDKPVQPDETTTKRKVDPKLHADAVRLIEVTGAKRHLQDNFEQLVDNGVKQMMENCGRCTPAFAAEWKKRFLARSNLQDYVGVYIGAYEKYFTDEEINELIALQKDKEASGTAGPSPALKEKLTSVMPSLMGEAVGGCAKIGAKLGAEIGSEIEREHPEYMKPPADTSTH